MGIGVPPVSDAELEVLKVLWRRGPATVRQVAGRLRRRRWAYNTVLTLLTRLREKQFVASEKGADAALVFSAAVSRDDLLRHGLTELADRICDGTASPLVHALVQGNKLSADDIARLRKMLDEMAPKE
ncbi:MAG TPA: BlaI/MecI/CopY family transcriptional regulator [Tepidisphaeraceae bacterium]|nr:BlaI/MecI/CopY family transcriptional regulator [Tepidisphaeraceae bacterium]